ncbi:MAG: light-harvesting antenna LH1, beta subunit [Anaerolineae bacterium]
MADNVVVVEERGGAPVYNNDRVPDKWKGLFTNEEWFMHDIVVKSTYGFLIIAIIAHTLVYIWQPWLP